MSLRGHLARFAVVLLAALSVLGTAQAQSNRYGIIVAVEDYKNTAPVAYAREDAELMRETFEKVLQIPPGNIQEYINPTNTDLSQIFGSGGEPGDIGNGILHPDAEVYVYFAGHGSKELDPVSNAMHGYLLATDSNPNRLRQTAYPYEHLIDQLAILRTSRFAAGKVFLFMESCFSGRTAAGELVTGVSASAFGGDPEPVKLLSEQRGIFTVSAAAGDQTAYWDREMENSVFTRFLADGLFGQADGVGPAGSRDKAVTVGELSAYLRTTVPRRALAMDASARQMPEVVDADPAMVLANLPKDFELTSDRLQGQRDLEERRIERELRRDISKMSTSVLRERLQQIRDWIAACTSGCDNLTRRRQEVENVLRACRVDRGVYRDAIQASDFDWLSEEIEAGTCDEAKVIAQACGASRSPTSDACECLRDELCVALPGAVASADFGQDNGMQPPAEAGIPLENENQAPPPPSSGVTTPEAEPPSSTSPNTAQPTSPASSDTAQSGNAGMLPDATREANVRTLAFMRDHKLPAGSWMGQSDSDVCQVDILWTEQDGAPVVRVKYTINRRGAQQSQYLQLASTDALTEQRSIFGFHNASKLEIGKLTKTSNAETRTQLTWDFMHQEQTVGALSITVTSSVGAGRATEEVHPCDKLTPVEVNCDPFGDPSCGLSETPAVKEAQVASLREVVGEGSWEGLMAGDRCFVLIEWREANNMTSARIRVLKDAEFNMYDEKSPVFPLYTFSSGEIKRLDASAPKAYSENIEFSVKKETPLEDAKSRVWFSFIVRKLDYTLKDVAVYASIMEANQDIEPTLATICKNLKKTSDDPKLPVKSDPAELARLIQTELKRVGCYSGEVDGVWGLASQRALVEFDDRAATGLRGGASEAALTAVRAEPDRVCQRF